MSHETVCGLANIGNTCYMNSVIQVIAHCPQISCYITSKKFKDTFVKNIAKLFEKEQQNNNYMQKITDASNHTITIQLFRLLSEMVQSNHIAPASFKNVVSEKNPTFIGCGQNDSHELLNFIIDTLHEETKECIESFSASFFPDNYHRVNDTFIGFSKRLENATSQSSKALVMKEYNTYIQSHQVDVVEHTGMTQWTNYYKNNKSVVSNYLSGMFISNITCATCRCYCIKFDTYTSISLEIPTNIENINLYDCLDKFTSGEMLDGDNMYQCTACQKKCIAQKHITFWGLPEVLIINFKRFQNNGKRIGKIDKFVDYPLRLELQKYMHGTRPSKSYELTSVVHHYGQCGGGHYISFNKCGDKWYEFNDSSTSLVADSELQRKMITDDSYIIVYNANPKYSCDK